MFSPAATDFAWAKSADDQHPRVASLALRAIHLLVAPTIDVFDALPGTVRSRGFLLANRKGTRHEKDPGLMTSQHRAFSEKKREVRK